MELLRLVKQGHSMTSMKRRLAANGLSTLGKNMLTLEGHKTIKYDIEE